MNLLHLNASCPKKNCIAGRQFTEEEYSHANLKRFTHYNAEQVQLAAPMFKFLVSNVQLLQGANTDLIYPSVPEASSLYRISS